MNASSDQPRRGSPPSQRTLFVGDLSFFCSETDLGRLFAQFGTVRTLEIKRGKSTGDSLMHGFVEMGGESSAAAALAALHGLKFMGRKLRVCWGSGPTGDAEQLARERESWVQLHVSFVTRQTAYFVTEELLDRVFSVYGELADVTVKRHKVTMMPPSQSGYGFVYFLHAAAALTAVEELRNIAVEGVSFDCGVSYKSEERIFSSADTMSQERLRRIKSLSPPPSRHSPPHSPSPALPSPVMTSPAPLSPMMGYVSRPISPVPVSSSPPLMHAPSPQMPPFHVPPYPFAGSTNAFSGPWQMHHHHSHAHAHPHPQQHMIHPPMVPFPFAPHSHSGHSHAHFPMQIDARASLSVLPMSPHSHSHSHPASPSPMHMMYAPFPAPAPVQQMHSAPAPMPHRPMRASVAARRAQLSCPSSPQPSSLPSSSSPRPLAPCSSSTHDTASRAAGSNNNTNINNHN